MTFVDELSTRYLRESRERLRDGKENGQAIQIFGAVLKRLSLLASPIIPFFTEVLYQNLVNKPKGSIHLEDWPLADKSYINLKLEDEVILMYQIAEKSHAIRKSVGIGVRQPLSTLYVKANKILSEDILEVLKQEINVENIIWTKIRDDKVSVELDTNITEGLREKGQARETIRTIQNFRKEAGIKFDKMVKVQLKSWPKKYEKQIMSKTFVTELVIGNEEKLLIL